MATGSIFADENAELTEILKDILGTLRDEDKAESMEDPEHKLLYNDNH